MADLIVFPPRLAMSGGWPKPGGAYEAFALAEHSPPLVSFFFADGLVSGHSYSRLEQLALEPGDGPDGQVLVIRFGGSQPIEVRAEGRNLFDLCWHLGYHRVQWIRELPNGREVPDDTTAVVTRIVCEQCGVQRK